MTLLPLVAVALVVAAVVVALGARWTLAWTIGLAGLAAVAVLSWVLEPGRVAIGSASLEIGGPQRAFIAAISTGGLLVGFVAAAASVPPSASAGLLVALAACGIAVAASEPILALWAVVGGGIAVLLAGALDPTDARARERRTPIDAALRAVAGSGAAGVFGLALAAPPLSSPAPDAGILGLAYLAVGVALVARLGSVPIHRWAARLADSVPVPLLAAMIVWLPAAFATLAAGWATGPLAAARVDLAVERSVVLAVGLGTVVLAAVAAVVRDDLGHAAAYLAISDLGLAVAAFAVPDPALSGSIARCLVALAASKTALIAWLVAVEAAYGARRLPDLDGWIRRSPLLGVALALVAAATVGWPASPLLAARVDVIAAAAPPVAPIAALVTLVVLVPYARMVGIGLRPAHGAVESSVTGRPRRPAVLAAADAGRLRERTAAAGRDARALWTLNRRPAAAVAALALAVLAAAVSAGAAWPVPPTATLPALAVAAPSAAASGAGPGVSESPGVQSAGASTQRSTSRP